MKYLLLLLLLANCTPNFLTNDDSGGASFVDISKGENKDSVRSSVITLSEAHHAEYGFSVADSLRISNWKFELDIFDSTQVKIYPLHGTPEDSLIEGWHYYVVQESLHVIPVGGLEDGLKFWVILVNKEKLNQKEEDG